MASSCCWAASGPDTRRVKSLITHGAATTVTALRTTSSTMAVVAMAEMASSASRGLRVRSCSTTTGMKTEESTPPSTSS